MPKPEIDISLEGVWKAGAARTAPSAGSRSSIDIPLDGGKARRGGLGIDDQELEFVNRHHEQMKEKRRRAREGK